MNRRVEGRSESTRSWIVDNDPLRFVLSLDPVLEKTGVAIKSEYVEMFWLPTVGPTTLWLARNLVGRLVYEPTLDGQYLLAELAAEIGCGDKALAHGADSVIVRALDRMVAHRFAARWADRIEVSPYVPRLSPRQVERLPARLRAMH